MMMDIFSSFDSYEYNSMLPFFIFLVLPMYFVSYMLTSYWYNSSKMENQLINNMYQQMTRTTGFYLKGLSIIVTSIFIMLILMNLMGMVPYMFSISSHLIFTLTFGIPMWLSLILSSLTYNPMKFTAHFLPDGAPMWLNPFLVLIETTSIMVRPLTLSFRLAANMSAGHIVLSLLGIYLGSAVFSSLVSSIILSMLMVGYLVFELAICIIQAYIFCLLISLYSDDHSH